MKKKHLTLVPAAAAVLTLSLSACSSSSADTADASATTGSTSTPSQGTAPGGSGGAGFPGANGEVAAIQGDVLQVQSATSGQVAVTLTGSTAVTTQVPTSLDELTVGSCVVVTGTSSDDSTTAATTVRVSEKVDGECTTGGGFGGGPGGDRPSGAPSDMPTDMPSDAPSDLPGNAPDGAGPGGGGIVAGEVTALDDGGFTVAAVQMGAPGEDTGDATTTDVTVTVGDDTTFTTTEDGTADDISVGVCVSARGDADDTGAITADSVSVTDKVDGACSTGGFGGGFGGPGGMPGNGSGDSSSSGDTGQDAA